MPEKPKSNLRWYILLTVIIGTFLGRLDQTIVSLALPKMIQDFSITVTSAGWISTAYILANAVFVPVWGKLGDTIGQKKVYILGFTIFIVGSIFAGFAWNLSSMLVFRVIQAIASSADYPTAMAILALTFKEGKERAQALGIWSSSFAAAAVFGPLLGGPLIDNFGWRSIFFINIPIGIVGVLMAMAFIREFKKGRIKANFDWWGAVVLGGSLTTLVLVLDQGINWGWISWQSLLCYFFTIIFGYIFVIIELKHKDPIVDMKFFKNSVFVNVIANNFIVFMTLVGGLFLIPIFAQLFLGFDATQTGYLFIPMAGMLLLAAPLGTTMIGRVKSNYVIMASTFMAGVGIYFLSFLDPRSTSLGIIIPMMIMAFGMGFGMPQRTNIVASVVPSKEIGSASSVLALVRNIAGAFGIAIYGTILQNSTYTNILNISQNSHLLIKNPDTATKFVALMSLKAQIAAYDKVFLIAAFFSVIGAATAYWIKVKKEIKAEVVMEG